MKQQPRYAYVRVEPDGSLRCADEFSREEIRRLKPAVGELVRVEFKRKRNYTQWKKAHQLGTLLGQNLDAFDKFVKDNGKVDSHAALKHLQRLSGVECEDMALEAPGIGQLIVRYPNSLGFDSMDEQRFQAAYSGFCAYIRKQFWPDMDEAAIEDMAKLVGDAG